MILSRFLDVQPTYCHFHFLINMSTSICAHLAFHPASDQSTSLTRLKQELMKTWSLLWILPSNGIIVDSSQADSECGPHILKDGVQTGACKVLIWSGFYHETSPELPWKPRWTSQSICSRKIPGRYALRTIICGWPPCWSFMMVVVGQNSLRAQAWS